MGVMRNQPVKAVQCDAGAGETAIDGLERFEDSETALLRASVPVWLKMKAFSRAASRISPSGAQSVVEARA